MRCWPASPWAPQGPVWSAFPSGNHGKGGAGPTDTSDFFKADKGCHISDFSDFQNRELLTFHCFLSDDHRLPSVRSEETFAAFTDQWRPIFTGSQTGTTEEQARTVIGKAWLLRHRWAWGTPGPVGQVGGHVACTSALDCAAASSRKGRRFILC